MNYQLNQSEIDVGVDTGKDQLDIHIHPKNIFFSVTNNEQGIKEAIKVLKKHNPN